MELNWPMEPLMCFGDISPRYMGRALRDIPGKKCQIQSLYILVDRSGNNIMVIIKLVESKAIMHQQLGISL